jgi:aminopeptidase N
MGLASRFINEQVHTSLLSDSSDNPQPLTNPGVGSPASVSAMFSTISYNKGAAIIRMTEHLMGFENHRMGLNRYLFNRLVIVFIIFLSKSY